MKYPATTRGGPGTGSGGIGRDGPRQAAKIRMSGTKNADRTRIGSKVAAGAGDRLAVPPIGCGYADARPVTGCAIVEPWP
ncbi:hypothetical protein Ate01nite_52930 [Actinoplanes teichomyceticus]|nr:hypothetical protein Ate01nite_52930 [Actinoplanes teichomyceticus]